MAIRFDCHQCGREFTALDASAGRETKCPDCGTSITIPPQSTLPDPEPIVIDESNAAPVAATVVDSEPVTPVAPSPVAPTPVAPTPTPAASSRNNRRRNRASSNTSGSTEPGAFPVSGKTFWLFTAALFGGCMLIVAIAIMLIEMFGW
jgi:DNA-directed RNA polymerase subunit RPC12/RpoP